MVKYTSPDSAETQRRFSDGSLKAARIAFWVGIALLVIVFAWLVASIFIGGKTEELSDKFGIYALIVAALPFAFGLSLSIIIKKNIKNAAAMPYITEYTFEDEFFTLTSYRQQENIAEGKVYYKELVKIKNNKNFIALYPNTATAYVIFKDGLTRQDLAEVLGYLNIKQ